MSASVEVLSKKPHGGRCTLYIAYAEEIAARFGLDLAIAYTEGTDDPTREPPGLVVAEHLIPPADGLILSPDDVMAGLVGIGLASKDDRDLLERLEAIEEQFMETLEDIS